MTGYDVHMTKMEKLYWQNTRRLMLCSTVNSLQAPKCPNGNEETGLVER